MSFTSSMTITGIEDLQRRFVDLGMRVRDLRRPLGNFGAQLIKTNRARLDRGVDVNGQPLKTKLSQRLGVAPLGGGNGKFGRSIKFSVSPTGDLELFSTFIGAGVAFRGDLIRPRMKQYLTIPVEARGGADARGRGGLSLEDNRTGRRALHYKDTFFLRRDDGKLWLVQKDGRTKGKMSGQLRFLFLLVKSVRYPRNEWLGASREDVAWFRGVLGRHLDTFDDNKGRR